MDKKPHNPQSSKPDLEGAKRVVFTLAIAASLGFWATFSRLKDETTAAAAANDATGDLPPVQAGNQIVLNLPPMPTLVPTLSGDPAATASFTSPAPVTIAAPVTSGGKIFLGGSKPGVITNAAARRAPVTRTRSSQ